jgi:selenoprotein W-related protein
LAATLLNNLKQKIEALKLIPAGGGCFEIMLDGELIYSKLKTNTFPNETDILGMAAGRARK